jgi:hypothetical protein
LVDYVYFSGKGSWFNHLINADLEFNKWHVTLHFNPESLDKFRELKLKTHLKKDDDGYYAKLSRPVTKLIRGKMVSFAPPKFFDKDGMPIDGKGIGNGSDITVKCEVYKYTAPSAKEKQNAIRLESVRVDNLVPYVPNRDYTKEQAAGAEGLMEQPAPLF